MVSASSREADFPIEKPRYKTN